MTDGNGFMNMAGFKAVAARLGWSPTPSGLQFRLAGAKVCIASLAAAAADEGPPSPNFLAGKTPVNLFRTINPSKFRERSDEAPPYREKKKGPTTRATN